MKFISTSFVLLSTAALLHANVGSFGGAGSDIIMEKNEHIQMVSEEVNITPTRSKKFMDGSLRDLAEYYCIFELKNSSAQEVTVQAGFPISSGDNSYLPHYNNDDFSNVGVVIRHRFIAGTDEDGAYAVRYERRDKEAKFSNIFLWSMTFAPHETKTLRVSYAMPGYCGLASLSQELDDAPKHFAILSLCAGNFFFYTTKTGASWAGTIEKAVFKLHLQNYEKYLDYRGLGEELHHKENVERRAYMESNFPVTRGMIYRHIIPETWKIKKEHGNKHLELEFTNFTPDMDIYLQYFATMFPRTAEDWQKLKNAIGQNYDNIKKYNERAGHATLSLTDCIGEVAGVILEFYGIGRDNPAIAEFLEKQIWYPVKDAPSLDEGLKQALLQDVN